MCLLPSSILKWLHKTSPSLMCFFKCTRIWQLSQYNLTKLFEMKLKTIKHHQSRRTEKNKRTFGPTRYIQTKHRSLRKRLNFKTFSQVTAVQLFSGSPKITRLLIIFKISKIEHRYFYTSIKVILLRTSACFLQSSFLWSHSDKGAGTASMPFQIFPWLSRCACQQLMCIPKRCI